MVAGNGLLLVGVLGCSLAPIMTFLLFSRFIQGLNASTSAAVVFAMIASIYQENKAIKLIGIMNAILTLMMVIAPVVGSFINQVLGWRRNCLAVTGISLISWFLLLKILPETKAKSQALHLLNKIFRRADILTSILVLLCKLSPSCVLKNLLTKYGLR